MAALKVGVVGCGAIAQACHLPGYKENANTEVVAVADPVPERLAEAKRDFGVPNIYADFNDMFAKEELDIVSICAPNNLHAAAAVEAAKRKIHILCEKPLAHNFEQAFAIKSAVEKYGVICMVNFTHRLYEGNIAAKAALDRNEIGAVTMFRIRMSHGGPFPGWAKGDWFYDKEQSGGGVLIDMGIHAIDLAQYLFGPVSSVLCRNATMIKDIDVEDTASMILDIGRGNVLGLVDVSWTSTACFTGVEIYGTDGSIIVDYTGGVRVADKAIADEGGEVTWRNLDVKSTAGGWSKVVDTFLDHINRGAQPSMDAAAGLSAIRVAVSAYESARTGRRINC